MNWGKGAIYCFLLLWAATELVPIVWMGYSSLKTADEYNRNIWGLPTSPTLANYLKDVAGQTATTNFGQYLINSSIVSFSSVLGIVLISVPAGYVIAKRGRISGFSLYFFLALVTVPAPAVLIPITILMRSIGFYDMYIGLILPYIAFNLPFSIVLARAFFKSFPSELEEAAKLDGLGEIGIFTRIVIPLSTVILVTLSIVNFPNVWNELLYALVLVPGNNVRTVQPGILLFVGTFSTSFGQLFAACVLSSVPMIVTFVFLQRYIIKGLALTAVKG